MLTTIAMLIVFVCWASCAMSLNASTDAYNSELLEIAVRSRCDYRELLVICGMGGQNLMERGDMGFWELQRAGWRSMRPIRDPGLVLEKLIALGVSSDAASRVIEDQKNRAMSHWKICIRCYVGGAAFVFLASALDVYRG